MAPLWTVSARCVPSEDILGGKHRNDASAQHRELNASFARGLENWKFNVLEEEKAVMMCFKSGGGERDSSKQKVHGFENVFREVVTEQLVYEKVCEPLLFDVWNGASCTLVECGAPQSSAAMLRQPLEALFQRIEEAGNGVSSSVLRFHLALQVIDVGSTFLTDAFNPQARVHIGADGQVQPQLRKIQIDSAQEGLDRVSSLAALPQTSPPTHRVVILSLERWVRSRRKGLLVNAGSHGALGDQTVTENPDHEGADGWSITRSELRLVSLVICETGSDAPNSSVSRGVGPYTSSHKHNLCPSVGKLLTAFCRCLREPGTGFRDAKLTHLLKASFTTDARCAIVARLANPSKRYGFSAGPFRFAERALHALYSDSLMPGQESPSDSAFTSRTPESRDRGRASPNSKVKTPRQIIEESQREAESKFRLGDRTPGTPKAGKELHVQAKPPKIGVSKWLKEFHDEIEREDDRLKIGTSPDQLDVVSMGEPPVQDSDVAELLAIDQKELVASRVALRDQLSKFQVGKDLLRVKHGEQTKSSRALASERKMQESDQIFKRLEDERRVALEKSRDLMQKVWEQNSERTKLVHQMQELEIRLDAAETAQAEAQKSIAVMQQRHATEVETLKAEHQSHLERAKLELSRKEGEELSTILKKMSDLEKERNTLREQLKQKHTKQAQEIEKKFARDLKEHKARAAEREHQLRQKLLGLQQSKRIDLEELALGSVEKDHLIGKLEQEMEVLQDEHKRELEKLQFKLEQQHIGAKASTEESSEVIAQLRHEVSLGRKVASEREKAHAAALDAAQRKINALEHQLVVTAGTDRDALLQANGEAHGLEEMLEAKSREAASLKVVCEEVSQAHEMACDDLERAQVHIRSMLSHNAKLQDQLDSCHETIAVMQARQLEMQARQQEERLSERQLGITGKMPTSLTASNTSNSLLSSSNFHPSRKGRFVSSELEYSPRPGASSYSQGRMSSRNESQARRERRTQTQTRTRREQRRSSALDKNSDSDSEIAYGSDVEQQSIKPYSRRRRPKDESYSSDISSQRAQHRPSRSHLRRARGTARSNRVSRAQWSRTRSSSEEPALTHSGHSASINSSLARKLRERDLQLAVLEERLSTLESQ